MTATHTHNATGREYGTFNACRILSDERNILIGSPKMIQRFKETCDLGLLNLLGCITAAELAADYTPIHIQATREELLAESTLITDEDFEEYKKLASELEEQYAPITTEAP